MNESGKRGALECGLDILEVLAQSNIGLGVSDVATQLSMDKGNTHRVLKTLVHRGYVEQNGATKRYRSSAKLVSVTGSVLRRLDVRAAAEEACEELVELTGESVHVSQVTASGPVYVLQRKAPFRVSVDTEIGSRPPMHATATGKAVLAHVTAAERKSLLAMPLESFTIRTLTNLDDLERELELTESRGYAIDDEEYSAGVRCVAAPVFGIDGTIVGCIGVSSPIHRMDISRVPVLADQVVTAAHRMTNMLGGPLERPTQDAAVPAGSERTPAQ